MSGIEPFHADDPITGEDVTLIVGEEPNSLRRIVEVEPIPCPLDEPELTESGAGKTRDNNLPLEVELDPRVRVAGLTGWLGLGRKHERLESHLCHLFLVGTSSVVLLLSVTIILP